MDTRSPEAQQILDRLDQQTARAIQRGDAAERMQSHVAQVRETATSRGREVSVQVDSEGHVTGITFGAAAFNLSPQQLSDLVLRTINQARAQADKRVVDLAAREFGETSPLTDIFRAHHAR